MCDLAWVSASRTGTLRFCRCENGGKEANSRTAIDVSDLDSGGPADGCGLEAVWLDAESVEKHRVVDDRHAQVEMSVALRLVGVVNLRLVIRRRVEERDGSGNGNRKFGVNLELWIQEGSEKTRYRS